MITIDKIPKEQLNQMRDIIVNLLYEINEDELRITSASEESLTSVVAHIFKEIAYTKGYKIALPFARSNKIIESVWNDISDGFPSTFLNETY